MFQDLLNEFPDRDQATQNFHSTIRRLCLLGKEWEEISGFASYYLVMSVMANSVSLMLGDIRFRTSYSSVITVFLDENSKIRVGTVNFDNFPDENHEVDGVIQDELIKKCLSSSYNKNIIKSINAMFGMAGDECKVQVRTAIFWSDMTMSAECCQKIFKTLGEGEKTFRFGLGGDVAEGVQEDLLPYIFMKQTNQISINGLKFKVRIRRNSITFDILAENETVRFFREFPGPT
ncbi:hypothetical protein PWG14_08355 (plasmid) [Chromobacterium amazonense]|uniref:hypothetical protein n=1 Tax=Chromobacterium amazonense TaxID=1382803 RepID=UPI00237D519C|nr:hypothetical protein [Chromobacterium amazonense]MDE1712696.1 hypothetical protein [Chromobacterium amazonense]